MLPSMDLFSYSSVIFLNSFLNIYNGMMLPPLSMSIFYRISTVILPTCISKCVVISDRFLFKYTEFILTDSISSSWGSCTTSIPTSYTAWSFLLLHTFLKWPIFPHLACFPICWALSGCMTPTTISAISICETLCLLFLYPSCFLSHFNFVKFVIQ